MSVDKKKLMKRITDEVGREKAIELVLQAYNTAHLRNQKNTP